MASAPKEILVIDDDDQVLRMVEQILTGAGYRMHGVETVAEAIEMVQERLPHLVITDLKLRGETGFEYLEKHRKLKGMQNVPVIVLSGVRDRETVYQAISLGAADYVTKPIDASFLVQKVKKALRDRKFPRFVLPPEMREMVQLSAPGKIVQANEIGFLLEVPVRIREQAQIEIISPLLRELGADTCVFQRTTMPARPGFPGQYLNDIAVIGMSAAHAARIREIVSGWG